MIIVKFKVYYVIVSEGLFGYCIIDKFDSICWIDQN